MNKSICLCGLCKKCRRRKVMKNYRKREKERKKDLEKAQKDLEIQLSLYEHKALQPSSTLNPYVSFHANRTKKCKL